MFKKLATIFFPYRRVFQLSAVVSAGATIYLLIVAELAQQLLWLQSALLAFIWSVLCYLLIVCFSLDEQGDRKRGFFADIKYRLIKLLQGIFTLLTIIVLLATLYFTFKLTGI